MTTLRLFVTLLVATFLVVACSQAAPGDDGTPSPTIDPGDTSEPAPDVDLPAGLEDVDPQLYQDAQAEGELSWYMTSPEEVARAMAAEFEELTGISVSVFQQTSAPLLESIHAQAARGELEADVVQFSDAAAILELIDAEIMAEFEPIGLDSYPDSALELRPYAYPDAAHLSSIVYNTNLVEGDDVELLSDFWGLTDPRFRGLVGLPDPALTGFGFNTHWTFREMIGEEEYRQWLEALAENEPRFFSSGSAVGDAVFGGELAIGWIPEGHGIRAYEDGAPVAISYQPEQLPAYFSVIGVVADSPNPNAARLFLTWFLSEPGQEAWMSAYNANSAHADVSDPRPHREEPWAADYSPDKLFFATDPQAKAEGRDDLLALISEYFPEIGTEQ